MRVIILPDSGEWVAVPKVATREMMLAARGWADNLNRYVSMIAAAPKCRVVKLPEEREHVRDYGFGEGTAAHANSRIDGWNEYRAAIMEQIERRAKG